MTIAVDFDGTIVEHRYPEIGRERPFATRTLRQLADEGHQLVLWSVREGRLLDEAVAWCAERGVHFHAVNANLDEDPGDTSHTSPRKLKVQLFIDDRNVGGLPDWGTIYQLISSRCSLEDLILRENSQPKPKKRHWWQRF